MSFKNQTDIADFSVKTECKIENLERLKNSDFQNYFEILAFKNKKKQKN